MILKVNPTEMDKLDYYSIKIFFTKECFETFSSVAKSPLVLCHFVR